MLDLIAQHQFWLGVALIWIFSAFVSGMPEPHDKSSDGYLWLFRALHSIAGNITTVFSGKIPGLKP